MIKLQEFKRLDKVSIAEIEKIIEEYEEIRMRINRELNAGKTFEKLISEYKSSKKVTAILEQIKAENCGG